MVKLYVIAALVIGILLGAVATILWDDRDARRDLSKAELSTQALGRQLMRRVADSFVANERSIPLEAGAGFYDTPKPYSNVLCRVNYIEIPAKVVRGHVKWPQEYWDDEIKVRTRYGVWKRPSAPAFLTREAACPKYRDFANLIDSEDGGAVERVVVLVGRARDLARSGKVNFQVSCKDLRGERPMACDGMALLRAIDVTSIRWVQPREKAAAAHSSTRVDEVGMAWSPASACGVREGLNFRVRSVQVYGEHSSSDGDILAIDFEKHTIC